MKCTHKNKRVDLRIDPTNLYLVKYFADAK